jgi:hypothetical protein
MHRVMDYSTEPSANTSDRSARSTSILRTCRLDVVGTF